MYRITKKYFYFVIVVVLLVLLLGIILYFTYTNRRVYKESFGIDENPHNFIQPQVYPNIISEDEARYILEKSKDNFKDSEILSGYESSIRKSKNTWISRDDPIVKNIIQRVCNIDNIPFDNAEDLQVVKYQPNGYYKEHNDSCCEDNEYCKEFLTRGGNRIVTMLIYLNDGFEGGATKFTKMNKEIKPDKYSGILFYSMNKNKDKCHSLSMHAGLPITSGEKYVANVWLRESKFT
jgi:prolyl 4-hydroxylase